MKKFTFYLLTAALILTSCDKDDPGFPGHVKDDSKLISDWIGLQLQLIRNTTGVTHIAFSRHFSYTGVALYESLVKADRSNKSIASSLNGNIHFPALPKGVTVFHPASANAAMATMLRFFYNAKAENVESIDSLEGAYFSRFQSMAGKKVDLQSSVDYGRQVAGVVLEWSKSDGSANANIPYSPMGEGYWEPTPPTASAANLPGWGNNRTIIGGSMDGSHPPAPVQFSKETGTPFHTMAKEVFDVSQSLTESQKSVAQFWDDAPNGKYLSVFGHWFSILKQVLEQKKTALLKGAEAYLLLGVSMNDATISCWKGKYSYHMIRPVTYIRKFMGYGEWSSLISTPPHPEYASAHSTISASGVVALESIFGKSHSFTDHSYDVIGMSPRSFPSFAAAANEAGLSRLYAGIHYRSSIEAGSVQGKKVGHNVRRLLQTH